MAPVDSGIVVSHVGTTYSDGRGEIERVVKSADRDKNAERSREERYRKRRASREKEKVTEKQRAGVPVQRRRSSLDSTAKLRRFFRALLNPGAWVHSYVRVRV